MMRFYVRLVAAALFLSPIAVQADPLSETGLGGVSRKGPEITDAMIDQKKSALDRVLSRRQAEAANHHSEAVALEGKLKQERMDFEKGQIAERKAFLDGLKKEPDAKTRSSQFSKFESTQKNDRRKFFNEQMSKRDKLTSTMRKNIMVEHEDVVIGAPAAAKPAAAPAKTTAKKAPAKK